MTIIKDNWIESIGIKKPRERTTLSWYISLSQHIYVIGFTKPKMCLHSGQMYILCELPKKENTSVNQISSNIFLQLGQTGSTPST